MNRLSTARTSCRSARQTPNAPIQTKADTVNQLMHSNNPEKHNRQRCMSSWCVFFCLSVGLLAASPRIIQFLGNSHAKAASASRIQNGSHSVEHTDRLITKPIEEIRCGDRVPSKLPLGLSPHDEPEPDLATWRLVELEIAKKNGDKVQANLLRPLKWLQQAGAIENGTFHLDVDELEIDGEAAVLCISPCPHIQQGNGQVVTGTFRHSADDFVELRVAGSEVPIICTSGHPIWSQTQDKFVKAGLLLSGEHGLQLDGKTNHLSVTTSSRGRSTVYNIEVNGTHVYHVGTQGLAVHNVDFDDRGECSYKAEKEAKENGGIIVRVQNKPSPFTQQSGHLTIPGAGTGEFHDFVFRDGRVFDAYQPRAGTPFEKWLARLAKVNTIDNVSDWIDFFVRTDKHAIFP